VCACACACTAGALSCPSSLCHLWWRSPHLTPCFMLHAAVLVVQSVVALTSHQLMPLAACSRYCHSSGASRGGTHGAAYVPAQANSGCRARTPRQHLGADWPTWTHFAHHAFQAHHRKCLILCIMHAKPIIVSALYCASCTPSPSS